jgi:hypothetical protein
LPSAGTAQGSCTLLRGSSGGQNVIHEKNVTAANLGTIGDRERSRKVAPPLLFVQANLGNRRSVASQERRMSTYLTPLGEEFRQQGGLIEASPTKSRNVQWHRDDDVMAGW